MRIFNSFINSVSSLSTLQIALGVSFVLHAVPLTVRFVDPESFNRVFQDTPLEVVLVNANTKERPVKAQAIAQSSMAGGGDADAGRATTFLPASELSALGDATVDTNRKLDTLQEQQTILLAQLKKQLALLPVPDPNNPSSSPEVQAVYYDQLRQKIEAKGTVNFPEAAGKKLYGQLTMILTVDHDGRILASEIVQGSGNLTLDRRAQAIANSAGPFGVFNAAMRAKADQIVLVSRFKFTRADALKTKLNSQ